MNQTERSAPSGSPATGDAGQSAADLASKGKDALLSAARSASETGRDVYERGEELIREARERYPEAERYYQRGSEALRPYVESPIAALILGLGLGFALSQIANHWSDRRRDDVPDYARTR